MCVFFDAVDMMTDLPGLRVPPGLSGALRYVAVGVLALVACVVHITTSLPHVCLAVVLTFFLWLLKHFRGLTSFLVFLVPSCIAFIGL